MVDFILACKYKQSARNLEFILFFVFYEFLPKPLKKAVKTIFPDNFYRFLERITYQMDDIPQEDQHDDMKDLYR